MALRVQEFYSFVLFVVCSRINLEPISAYSHIRLSFIVATGRTGSTLLSSMLNMNPFILSCFEEPFAYNLYFKYHHISNWTSETIQNYCRDFFLFSEGKLVIQFGTRQQLIDRLEEHKQELNIQLAVRLTYLCFCPDKDKSQVKVVVDKQLKMHTFLEEMAAFYPDAKFIILYRDPRDNAVVKYQRALRKNRKGNHVYYAKSWEHEYGQIYKKSRRIGMERFTEVRYEDLVSDPEAELKKICDFLNVPYSDGMLHYDEFMKQKLSSDEKLHPEFKKKLNTIHESLTQKVHTDKVDIWKSNLSTEDAAMIWETCSDIAEKAGYEAGECSGKKAATKVGVATYLRFKLYKVWGPAFYFSLPFSLRYKLKRIKYRNRFKGHQKYKGPFMQ